MSREVVPHDSRRRFTPSRAKMETSTEIAKRLRHRHLDYYVELAEACAKLNHTFLVPQEIEENYNNLRSALRWALDSDRYPDAIRLIVALNRYWIVHRSCKEGLRYVQEALSRKLDASSTAAAEGAHAEFLFQLGQYSESELIYERARALAVEAGVGDVAVKAGLGAVWAAWFQGDAFRAGEKLASLVDNTGEIADVFMRVRILEAQGWIAVTKSDHETVRRSLDRATQELERAGDLVALAEHLGIKSEALKAIGETETAQATHARAVEIYLEHAPRHPDLADDLTRLAQYRYRQGDRTGAMHAVERAIALSRDPASEGKAYVQKAIVETELGDLEAARLSCTRAKEAFDRDPSRDRSWIAYEWRAYLADLVYEHGDLVVAEGLVRRAAESAPMSTGGEGLTIGVELAQWAETRGDTRAALGYWSQVATTAPPGKEWEPTLIGAQAAIMRLEGDIEGARVLLRERLEALAETDEHRLGGILLNLAITDLRADDLPAAREHGKAALATTSFAGAPLCLALMARAALLADDMDDVERWVRQLGPRWRELRDPTWLSHVGVARSHVIAGSNPEGALRLLAAVSGFRKRIDFRATVPDQLTPKLIDDLRGRLGSTSEEMWTSSLDVPIRAAIAATDTFFTP